jgi:hypothetical protein
MIDVKKLITGFLIVATAAVCSGLIFSFVNITPSVAGTTTTPQITIQGGNGTLADNTNAFLPTESDVDQVAAALAPDLASSNMFVSSTDPGNLTDALATEFVNGVVAANPNGPTTDSPDGNPVISTPNINALAASVASASTTQTIQIPDWDAEAESIPVSVIPSNSAALTSYGDAMNDVLNNHLNSQVQGILNDQTDSASASDISYLESQMQEAVQDASSLKTPVAAKAYQESLLTDLVYQKNMLQLYTLAQTDPVKASLIFQQEDEKFSTVQENLLNQAQILTTNDLSLQQIPEGQHGDPLLSFVDDTFGIPKAQALLPVFDPATWGLIEGNEAQVIGHQLEVLLKNTLLQILKNTLIAIIQREVVTWIQGSGAPRFITNWGTQLVNAAQTSALNAINAQMSCGVYPAFIPQIKITLDAYYKPGGNTCANQFAAALGSNSFQQFYNNFKNGGFVAFGASTLPSGNPYGQLFFNAQSIAFTSNNAQAATALKTQTSGGFTGGQVCDDGSDPNNGEHTVCENPDGPDYTINTSSSYDAGNESCGPGDTPVVYANQGTCSDGTQPVVTTPSAVTGFALNTAMVGTTQQVAAANDIAGVLNSVLSSLMTSLASFAVNATGQLVNQSLTSLNAASITAGATTAAPAAIPLACNPTTQTIPSASASAGSALATGSTSTSTAPATLSAIGGTTDSNGNPPIYYWTDSNGASSTGTLFSDTFTTPGTYTVTLSDSVGDTPATCTVVQQ